jgi:hypothetical protein
MATRNPPIGVVIPMVSKETYESDRKRQRGAERSLSEGRVARKESHPASEVAELARMDAWLRRAEVVLTKGRTGTGKVRRKFKLVAKG